MTATDTPSNETHVVDVRVGPQPRTPKPPAETTTRTARTVINTRPVAGLLGNAAMIGGASAYAAAGVAGLAAAGVATGAVAAAAGAAALRRKAAAKKAGTGAAGRVGKARAGKTGRPSGVSTGTGRTPAGGSTGRKTAGTSPARGGKTSPAGTGKPGVLGGILGKAKPGGQAKAQGKSPSGSGGAHAARPSSLSRKAADKAAKSRKTAGGTTASTGLGRTARAAGKALSAPARAASNAKRALAKQTTGRKAAAQARRRAQLSNAVKGKKPRWWKGWGSWLLAGAAGGVRSAWRKARNRKLTEDPKAATQEPKKPDVGTEVRRTPDATPAVATPAVAVPAASPKPFTPTPATTVVSTTTGGPRMSRHLLALSEEMVTAAARYEPDGMLEYGDFLRLYPEILENVAKACRLIAQNSTDDLDVHAIVTDTLEAIHHASLAVVGAAEQASPSFEKIHSERLEDLRNPRRGAEKWDHAANRSH